MSKPVIRFTGWPELYASDDGRIWRKDEAARMWRRVLPRMYRGYEIVGWDMGQFPSPIFVHRLVARAFHGPKPDRGHVVRHLNDVKTDNRACNLAWGTQAENIADARRNGIRLGRPPGGANSTPSKKRRPKRTPPHKLALIKAEMTGARGEIPRLAYKYSVSLGVLRRTLKAEARA